MTRSLRELSDTDLLEAHQQGDPEAFGELFGRHRDRLWAVSLRTTANPEDAADALQDAMISAFRAADSFRGEARVTTWLHRIVVNACLDRLRRNKVRAADALPDDLEEYAARGAVLASSDESLDPEARALMLDKRRALLGALDGLPPEQKAAVILVDMEGYPVSEVALMLDCPTGTVKSRCARGRAKLAGALRAAGFDGTVVPRETSQPQGAAPNAPASRIQGGDAGDGPA